MYTRFVRDQKPSFTAAWVAMCRALGAVLPPESRLIDDPLGAELAGPLLGPVARAAVRRPHALSSRALVRAPFLSHFVVYMQLRSRAIDDPLLEFVKDGGRQVLVLGAGFDARASRLARELEGARVFEVDHPATQAQKRAAMARAEVASSDVRYVAWDFERDTMSELPARLAEQGHDARAPTFTIWEGVTMYLTNDAIEASMAAVRELSSPGSILAFTYFERERIDRPPPLIGFVQRVVASRGEPFRWGLDKSDVRAWLEARGWLLERDRDARELAREMLPPRFAKRIRDAMSHVAIARFSTTFVEVRS
jgi:methyltransferase (TIGR00027 family)